MTRPDQWTIEHRRAPAAELHAAPIPDPAYAAVWICEPTAPALVLGSTQGRARDTGRWDHVDIELVVRRSGGGAVLVAPEACTWLDFIVPAGHQLWDDDVGRAAHWVGELWVRALARFGIDASVHTGGMVRSDWTSLVCFAGVGPGEVLDPTGAKLVGISQRRTRHAARFQTIAYHRDPTEIVGYLDLAPAERAALTAELKATTATVAVDPADLAVALQEELPV